MYDEPKMDATPRDERISMVAEYCQMERDLAEVRETIESGHHRSEKLQATMAALRNRLAEGLGLAETENKAQAMRGDY